MQILGVRQQFIADHSSTNYLFYAAKPISKESHAIVSKLSSHVDVTQREARITYHSDFADLGEERRVKFLAHFDVEVQESYDWWALSVMLEKSLLPDPDLTRFVAEGEASLTFEEHEERLRLRVEGMQLDYNATYREFGEDLMEGLAELGLELRAELYSGQVGALAAIKQYCEENSLPQGAEVSTPVTRQLCTILSPLA